MESSTPVPHAFVTAPELSELASSPGPFASVYLSTEGEVHDAAEQLARRWKTVRASLADQGAGEDVLEAIDSVVPESYQQGQGLAVMADQSGVRHLEHHPERPDADIGEWGPLPALARLIEWRQINVAHVVVRTDRQGADLVGVRRQGPDLQREAGGDDHPLSKVGAGGWSQRRFQQRAENTWESNADDVAQELVGLVDRIGAQLVVVAGDVRAVQMLRDALPSRVGELVHEVEGGRAADGSESAMDAEIDRLVAEVVDGHTAAALEKFDEERGQHDRASDGVGPTVAALARAQVAGLLVDPGALAGREAFFGPEPTQVATDPGDLASMGVDVATQAPLVDVVVRSALGTGAGVRIVRGDEGPRAGIGALLRWPG